MSLRWDRPADEPAPCCHCCCMRTPQVCQTGPASVWTTPGPLLWHPEEKHWAVQQLCFPLCLSFSAASRLYCKVHQRFIFLLLPSLTYINTPTWPPQDQFHTSVTPLFLFSYLFYFSLCTQMIWFGLREGETFMSVSSSPNSSLAAEMKKYMHNPLCIHTVINVSSEVTSDKCIYTDHQMSSKWPYLCKIHMTLYDGDKLWGTISFSVSIK